MSGFAVLVAIKRFNQAARDRELKEWAPPLELYRESIPVKKWRSLPSLDADGNTIQPPS